MTEPSTVLRRARPNDGFRASCARWIRSYGKETARNVPDSPGAGRHVGACNHLASYIERVPLWDPRFRLLWKVAEDSDRFTPAGNVQQFISLLGLDKEPPTDVDATFTEFAVEAVAALKPGPSRELDDLRARMVGNRQEDHARIRELEDEVEKRDLIIATKNQEASDLRGELKQVRREASQAVAVGSEG